MAGRALDVAVLPKTVWDGLLPIKKIIPTPPEKPNNQYAKTPHFTKSKTGSESK